MQLKKRVLNSDISIIAPTVLIEKIVSGSSGYICFSNVHMVVEAYKDLEFQRVVNEATYAVADGVPIQKSLKLLYGINQERIAGMDFMPSLVEAAAKEELSVFFYGASEETLKTIKKNALSKHPEVRIVGMISPPFRPLTEEEKEKDIQNINNSGAKIVFVGLGCPKQEKWMAENTKKIDAILLGVGAAFETYSGIKRMAPGWMRDSGIEWIYRLFQDPRRLWKRYLNTNSLFLFLILRQLFWIKVLGRSEKHIF